MVKIYVAGALSGPELDYLENMRHMMVISTHLWQVGMSPYCPCLDFVYALLRSEDYARPTTEQFHKASLEWIDSCDAMLVLPHSENSKGTNREVMHAHVRCNIPVFYKPNDLLNYFCFPLDPTMDALFEKWGSETAGPRIFKKQ